nr:PREDICTED: uncharacterized protein LOC104962559 [Notothenia coriiceps]
MSPFRCVNVSSGVFNVSFMCVLCLLRCVYVSFRCVNVSSGVLMYPQVCLCLLRCVNVSSGVLILLGCVNVSSGVLVSPQVCLCLSRCVNVSSGVLMSLQQCVNVSSGVLVSLRCVKCLFRCVNVSSGVVCVLLRCVNVSQGVFVSPQVVVGVSSGDLLSVHTPPLPQVGLPVPSRSFKRVECERTVLSSFYLRRMAGPLPVVLSEEQRGDALSLGGRALEASSLRGSADTLALTNAPPLQFSAAAAERAPHLKRGRALRTPPRLAHPSALTADASEDCSERRRPLSLDACNRLPALLPDQQGRVRCQLAVGTALAPTACLALLESRCCRPAGLEPCCSASAALRAHALPKALSSSRQAQRCMDFLLVFLPLAPTDRLTSARDEPQRWPQAFTSGKTESLQVAVWPGSAPLLLQALRCLARSGPGQISALPVLLAQPQLAVGHRHHGMVCYS